MDSLREELFCNSTFGSRIGRIGDYRAEVRPAGSDHFYDTNGLARSEMTIAVTDVVRRMIRADPRPTLRIPVVDSSLFFGRGTSVAS